MLDVMTAIPPIPHRTTMTSSDVVAFWVIIAVIAAVVLLITIILAIAGNRGIQRQSQMKAADRHDETSPQTQSDEQPQVRVPEEKQAENRIQFHHLVLCPFASSVSRAGTDRNLLLVDFQDC
jgi:hypothetical protein